MNPAQSNASVLVVDDTDHVRQMLVDMLELDGFDIAGEAASGREAIEITDEVEPDVVVMDYKMPGMDGLTAARAIRDSRPSQAIILYTAYLDDALESRARDAGIAVCVGKVEGLTQLERHIVELSRDLTQR
jgi:two-component system, response regulator PdtaR